MNRLILLPLVLPFTCLALLSLVAFIGVVAIGGGLRAIGLVTAALDIAGRKDEPWGGADDAHPIDYVEVAQ